MRCEICGDGGFSSKGLPIHIGMKHKGNTMAMDKKPVKPASPTITILPSSDLSYAGHLDYAASVPLDGHTQAHIVVTQDGVVVLNGYSTTYPNGDKTFALGPTPMWQGGAGKGAICLATYNERTGGFDTIRGSLVSFDVAA